MKRILSLFSVSIFLTLISVMVSFGQVSLTTLNTPYTENFDGLGTATFNLTNNTSITGVYAFRSASNATPNVFTAEAGGTNTEQFKNYGTAAAADRALGSLAGGGTGTMYYGVRFVNNTGSTITALRVTYTGEQWRDSNTADQSMTFAYNQGATVTSLNTGTYTAVTALNFTSPISVNADAALDGNLTANRTTLSYTFNVSIPNGQEIMIRWLDANDTGDDHGFAIDDLSVTPLATSPVSFATIGNAVTENFDQLSPFDFNLLNGATITGVYATRQSGNATPNVFDAEAGTDNAGEFNNYGSTGAADRALGSLASGGTNNIFYGVRYVNNTGVAITELSVTYTGEQWRRGSTGAEVLAFSYQQAATVTSLTAGTWTNVTALNFTSLQNAGAAIALDGNAGANRTTITNTFAVNIPAGQEIMLRWTDVDDTDGDHGLAIDDLSVTPLIPTAAAVNVSGRVLSADGRALSKVQVTITDLQGNSRTTMTNTFGFYNFEGIEAGESYILSANSKQYVFNPIAVQVQDNISDLNIIAEP